MDWTVRNEERKFPFLGMKERRLSCVLYCCIHEYGHDVTSVIARLCIPSFPLRPPNSCNSGTKQTLRKEDACSLLFSLVFSSTIPV